MNTDTIDDVLFDKNYEKVVKSDYAILLGAAPEYAKVRAKIAASFYSKGGAKKIIATGGMTDNRTECSVMREELIKCGVPEEDIIEEPRACDTIQNMTCALTEICKRNDIMEVENVTVISEPFHMKRSVCLAKILLPSFICVYGYTEGVEKQRKEWKTDERLFNCVTTEVEILRSLAKKGRIPDTGI